MSTLAYFGGEPAIKKEEIPEKHLFGWPIITEEDEEHEDRYRNGKPYSETCGPAPDPLPAALRSAGRRRSSRGRAHGQPGGDEAQH